MISLLPRFRIGVLAAAFLSLTAALAQENVPTRVSISSQPEGARIIIDGRDRGTTPQNLFDLKPGRHHLKYKLAGYEDLDRFFNTQEENLDTGVLVAEKGLLLLKTDPAGCDVQIDGVSVGQTPCLITTLAAKDTYSVKLRKAGYLDQEISVKFDGRKPLERFEKFVLASGTIDITSEPAGAEVTVNGIVKGTAPLKVTDVPKGRAIVKFHLDGYADEERDVAVNAGDTLTLPVVLKGLPGTLQLTSVPEGARFYVNGEMRGKSPVSITHLQPGSYEVRAELDGYSTETKTIAIDNGESASEEFRLTNVMGQLELRTFPIGAQVLLDGHPVGTTKAKASDAQLSDILSVPNVREGEHTLTVRAEGYGESVSHPRIESSKTLSWTIRLKRIFEPNIEIESTRGTYRGMFVSSSPSEVVIEAPLGVMRNIPRNEIRKLTYPLPKK